MTRKAAKVLVTAASTKESALFAAPVRLVLVVMTTSINGVEFVRAAVPKVKLAGHPQIALIMNVAMALTARERAVTRIRFIAFVK